MVDISVNRWIIAARQYFVDAISHVAAEDGLDTKAKVCDINEQKVLQYLTQSDIPQVAKRSANILNSTVLSFDK